MRKYIKIVSSLLFIFLTCSCAFRPVNSEPKWRAEKNGIQLYLTADPQLHLYEGSPHTLYICIYQLTGPNAFNERIRNKEGLAELLECRLFDASVARSHSLTLYPGEERTEQLDRAEGTKYVGLVAGYYSLKKENMTRLLPVPVVQSGWIIRELIAGRLNENIYFGPEEIK